MYLVWVPILRIIALWGLHIFLEFADFEGLHSAGFMALWLASVTRLSLELPQKDVQLQCCQVQKDKAGTRLPVPERR